MKAADIEWGMLRGALIALAIAAVVAGVLLGVSYRFWESNDRVLKRAKVELAGAEQEYRRLDELEQMIANYYPKFQDLQRVGIIGEERRLNWTEALKRADADLKLPSLTYSVETRTRHSTEFPLADGAYKLFASEMKLDLGLLHGEDLLNFFSRLDESADGLFSVDECRLARQRETPGSWKEAHLRAGCKLNWYTINKPDAQGSAS